MNDAEPILKKCINNRIRLIGGLFLSAFVFYGGGTALVSSGQQTLGLVLMLINSAVVLSIGVLISSIIARDAPYSAIVYFITRLSEAALLGAGAVIWALGLHNPYGEELNIALYRLAMIILGLGSIGFCHWLIATRTVHVLLACLGFVGYPLIAMAMIAAYFGSEFWAHILLIPGAAFELTFGLLLLFGGLRSPLHTSQKMNG